MQLTYRRFADIAIVQFKAITEGAARRGQLETEPSDITGGWEIASRMTPQIVPGTKSFFLPGTSRVHDDRILFARIPHNDIEGFERAINYIRGLEL